MRKPPLRQPGSVRPVLILLFAASGCAALVYEVVWLQMLELVLGSTAASMAVLLGVFMGGMCLGSLALPRRVPAHWNALRVYGALELCSGVFGLLVPAVLPAVQRMYVTAGGGPWELGARSLVCAVCLLPPTAVLGATLPAVARRVGAARCGALYAANTLGGVIGCLGSGFWLLRVYDMQVAEWAAAAINFGVALAAFAVSGIDGEPGESGSRAASGAVPGAVLAAAALSGLSALGAEVVWTRLLALSLGPTVYTFSIILAVFLFGLGGGGGLGAWLAARPGNNRKRLAWMQALLVPSLCWGAWLVSAVIPAATKDSGMSTGIWAGFGLSLACCTAAVLPSALLWGASFPLALGSCGPKEGGHDEGRAVAAVYAANTAGAILGAVAFSVVLAGWTGSATAGRLLVAVAGLGALAASGFGPVGAAAAGAAVLAWLPGLGAVPEVPWQLLAFGRRMPVEAGPWKKLYAAEGVNSSIAYTEWVDGLRYFHVAGKVEASNSPFDMKVQRLLGHMPALLHPDPQSVLVVGCGAGVTAGSFVVHRQVRSIELCEIEPLIPPASARFFGKENHHFLSDLRTRVVIDDARHHVLTTRRKFDIITSDPIHPWVKGSAALYTKEYFEMVRAHLNPGGLATQWVPLYESDLATVRSEIATFLEVFPEAVVWGNYDLFDQGYDVVLMGSNRPIRIDVDLVQARIDADPRIGDSLRGAGWRGAADLLGTYASRTADLRAWLQGAEINRDSGLRLQYLAGMGLNSGRAGWIYGEMERRSPFPVDLFRGSPEAVAEVRRVFDAWRLAPL